MYFVYLLYSDKFDRIYIGQTNNIAARLDKHNKGDVSSTKAYIPWKIVRIEQFRSRGEAMRKEKILKSQKGRDFIRENLLNWQSPAEPD